MNRTDAHQLFVERLDRHRGILLRVAGAYCSNAGDREDLLAETVAQLWRSYRRFDGRSSFSTWMYRVAMNVAISFRRSEMRASRSTVPPEASFFETIAQPHDEPEDERLALIRDSIEQLDPNNRALMLLYLDDHTYAEIAEILGLSETNVATKLGRIRERLKRNLTDATRQRMES